MTRNERILASIILTILLLAGAAIFGVWLLSIEHEHFFPQGMS